MKTSSWSACSGLFYKPANVGVSNVGWRTVSVLLLFWFDSAFFRAWYSRCLLFISCLCSSDISARCFVAWYSFLASYALHHPDHLIAYRRPHTSSIQHEIYFRVNKVCCVLLLPVSWTLVISLSASRFWVGVSMINQHRGTLTWVYRKWESYTYSPREKSLCKPGLKYTGIYTHWSHLCIQEDIYDHMFLSSLQEDPWAI